MSLNVPRVAYIIARCYLRTIIHDCGIVRLLFRYYVVAYSPEDSRVRASRNNEE